MSVIDILIICLILVLLYLGFKRGFIRQTISILAIIIGVVIGSRLAVVVDHEVQPGLRPLIGVAITLVSVILLLYLLEFVNRRLHVLMLAKNRLIKLDKYAGIAISFFGGIFLIWLAISFCLSINSANQQNLLLSSKIINFIDARDYFGKPAFDIFYEVVPDKALNIGQIEAGPGQPPPYSIDSAETFTGDFKQGLTNDYPSVVEVIRNGCFVSNSYGKGSGYVALPDMVVTAAHVVSGSDTVSIETVQGRSYIGNVIDYDFNKDLAIIYVPNLPNSPLQLDSNVQQVGQEVASLGFPGQNGFSFYTGTIEEYGSYKMLNIDAPTLAEGKKAFYYKTTAASFPGDSGGPMITTGGRVIGHFTIYQTTDGSYDPSDDHTSDIANTYGVALSDYYSELIRASHHLQRASTGYCSNE